MSRHYWFWSHWAGALVLILALVISAPNAGASEGTEIQAAEVKRMMAEENALVIFPLSRIEFNALHIPGSVNIAMDHLAEKLPADKERSLVFYCLGRT